MDKFLRALLSPALALACTALLAAVLVDLVPDVSALAAPTPEARLAASAAHYGATSLTFFSRALVATLTFGLLKTMGSPELIDLAMMSLLGVCAVVPALRTHPAMKAVVLPGARPPPRSLPLYIIVCGLWAQTWRWRQAARLQTPS